MALDDHVEMLAALKDLAGMVVLSGYPSPVYDEALVGWHRIERAAFADGARPRIEVLWINPRAWDALTAERAKAQCYQQSAFDVGAHP
jgi:DNA adenine methylase